ncbi:hypothetical protein [Streptomyces mirabilis]|uniref:hypothetical protein n=1 Tax=Streptomyces mirabilis TaxID=68239 RepID=UPI0036D7D9E9
MSASPRPPLLERCVSCSPCRHPAPDLILDATGQEAFNAAYEAAKQQRAVFVAVERLGLHWTVDTDALTAPQG